MSHCDLGFKQFSILKLKLNVNIMYRPVLRKAKLLGSVLLHHISQNK